ncbi:SpoIIE family protein phosphatase [bacterium]|nr:SpoIIE family protein phosphatase [candidate division CSSED10-310 bacterium]
MEGSAQERLQFILTAIEEMEAIAAATGEFDLTAKYMLRQLLGTIPVTQGAILRYSVSSGALKLHTFTGTMPRVKILPVLPAEIDYLVDHSVPFPSITPPSNMTALLDRFLAQCQNTALYEVWLPMVVKREFLGIIILGKKLGTDVWLEQDFSLVKLLARPVALFYRDRRMSEANQAATFKLNLKILELENIQEMGIALNSLRQADEIAREILVRATALLDSRYGILMQRREDRVLYKVEALFGFEWRSDVIPENIKQLVRDLNKKTREKVDLFDAREFYSGDKLVATPLRTTTRGTLGVLCVANKESRQGFIEYDDHDRKLLQSFAALAAVALENAMLHESELEKERLEREIELAAEIQRNILPSSLPSITGYEIYGRTIPCRMVGGDFYEFFPDSGRGIGLSIADVTGKGVPAALLVFTLHAALNLLQDLVTTPTVLMRRINHLISVSSAPNKFITCFAAYLDTERHCLRSVNAGHNYPVIIPRSGPARELSVGGLPLGIMEEWEYEEENNQLRNGDIVLFYTDGVTEVRNQQDEEFGVERLIAVIRELRDLSVHEIGEGILERVMAFSVNGLESDDFTLMLLRRNLH